MQTFPKILRPVQFLKVYFHTKAIGVTQTRLIIHCLVLPVCVKHSLDFHKNNACCSIIIGVLPLEIGQLNCFPIHFGSYLKTLCFSVFLEKQ